MKNFRLGILSKTVSPFRRLKRATGNLFFLFLDGHRDHYACVLRSEAGPILRFIFHRLFKRIAIAEEELNKIRELSRKGVVVYALKHSNQLEFLFFHYRYAMEGLPHPTFGHRLSMLIWQPIGQLLRIALSRFEHFLDSHHWADPYTNRYVQQMIQNGEASVLVLIDKGLMVRVVKPKVDPILHLIEAQRNMMTPIYIIPQMVVYQRLRERSGGPLVDILFGDEENPGRLRKLALFLSKYRKSFVRLAPELNVQEFLDKHGALISPNGDESLAFAIRQELLRRIDDERRVISGPVPRSRQEIKEMMLRDPVLLKEIQTKSEREGKPVEVIKRHASALIDEIVADLNPSHIKIWDRVLGWLWNNIYDGIQVDQAGLSRVREAARKGPLVLVPSHKSHIDYLVLSHVLYRNQMNLPLVAAGLNLAFWPLGFILRKSGAYFIRRNFRGDRLYPKVVSRYLRLLIREGFWQEFFIEGGRSRTGKLYQPKMGMLSMLINAFEEAKDHDLIFIPVFIGYDRIIEEGAYLRELRGESKQAESLSQLVRIRKYLKKRYGRAYITFGEPISVSRHLASLGSTLKDLQKEQRRTLYHEIARQLTWSINKVSVVTPFSLVAAAILCNAAKGFSKDDLIQTMQIFLQYLRHKEVQTASTLDHFDAAVDKTLANYQSDKCITRLENHPEDQDDEVIYSVAGSHRLNLEYYKNNILHFFLPASLVAVSLLSYRFDTATLPKIRDDVAFLLKLFKFEFIYAPDIESGAFVDHIIGYFRQQGYLKTDDVPDVECTITPRGVRCLPLFAGLIENYIESYRIVLRVLQTSPHVDNDKILIQKAHRIGHKLYIKGELRRMESLSAINFKNALRFYWDRGWVNQTRLKREGQEPSQKDRDMHLFGKQLQQFLRWNDRTIDDHQL
ncbi:MAG: 1-acyl-sn-glycerol-3-phosphate acyltransferase [Deltaproteobacteria bacterium]|nr:1-acyl-sn-glycerol-3-phosphate acyltransferase [Deltaproteobacteria bacterium]